MKNEIIIIGYVFLYFMITLIYFAFRSVEVFETIV